MIEQETTQATVQMTQQLIQSWAQVATMIISTFTMIYLFRKESREDWKIIHLEIKDFREVVRLEMKDFHERLLEIEMNRKK